MNPLFKPRSTTDAIFIVREAIKSTKNPLYLCMIDLRAAYDHVDCDMLFSVLDTRTKAPKITSLLKALYTGSKSFYKKYCSLISSAHWLSPRRN